MGLKLGYKSTDFFFSDSSFIVFENAQKKNFVQ